ncbi:hypothetical protein BUALT_Bualt11G0022200 [Buddleja alternifolia]|uniref:Serine hydrolase domain-containing protein n=1 Tax=Buddleja alternifolia TaxID=168488 RepID=A0AAV6X2Q8_9LAMI|nr:hypothetical protein BUALT_Bualt11G0022200 [Buddleja alternifolia]
MEELRNESEENEIRRKPRILCLHGFRTSGKILEKLIFRWPENVAGELDLVFPDAPFAAQGKSDVEGIFDPPYFEWFQSDQAAIEDQTVKMLKAVVMNKRILLKEASVKHTYAIVGELEVV